MAVASVRVDMESHLLENWNNEIDLRRSKQKKNRQFLPRHISWNVWRIHSVICSNCVSCIRRRDWNLWCHNNRCCNWKQTRRKKHINFNDLFSWISFNWFFQRKTTKNLFTGKRAYSIVLINTGFRRHFPASAHQTMTRKIIIMMSVKTIAFITTIVNSSYSSSESVIFVRVKTKRACIQN